MIFIMMMTPRLVHIQLLRVNILERTQSAVEVRIIRLTILQTNLKTPILDKEVMKEEGTRFNFEKIIRKFEINKTL